MTEFTYEEWHRLWKAIYEKLDWYTLQIERFEKDKDTELWIHFVKQADDEALLLKKIEKMANEHFPAIYQKEPNRCTQESATSAEKDTH